MATSGRRNGADGANPVGPVDCRSGGILARLVAGLVAGRDRVYAVASGCEIVIHGFVRIVGLIEWSDHVDLPILETRETTPEWWPLRRPGLAQRADPLCAQACRYAPA